MQTTILGFPRIGEHRELKAHLEKYFRKEESVVELQAMAAQLRKKHWMLQKEKKLDILPVNDFSFYDTMLDTIVLLGAVPKRYRELRLSAVETYFAMARGYQGENGDVKALGMKKWFNTNYHYMVPELADDMKLTLCAEKPLQELAEVQAIGGQAKLVVIGPYTFLKLAHYTGKKQAVDFADALSGIYCTLLQQADKRHLDWMAFDEPALVMDMTDEDRSLLHRLYTGILTQKGAVKCLCQTFFGDVRDCYDELVKMDFDGIGLDFCESKMSKRLLQGGFPKDKILFAGVINGKNIWRSHYAKKLFLLRQLQKKAGRLVLSSSCSLLHVPFTTANEEKMGIDYTQYFAFAVEKIQELAELKMLLDCENLAENPVYAANTTLFSVKRVLADRNVQERMERLSEADFVRRPFLAKREKIQKRKFKLPVLPTTTIGSFPQTQEVRKNRADFRQGRISEHAYRRFNRQKIAECIQLQEKIGLDVLVHGEFERNDMVEYFGEHLQGFLFTQNGWVQSYGTRCVKPPIIWSDVSRREPMTVQWSVYAQSLTCKRVKGMLTGPVTILNWSFPREDISLKKMAFQIALALRDEVLDLEKNDIQMIQIDEAALREKLPLRKSDWHAAYLNWAIPAFRLVHSGVQAATQIHTHMCYSEFGDILDAIDAMDADVITFEAARSDLQIVDTLALAGFQTEVGPGVYDIHSPRVPAVAEIEHELRKMMTKLSVERLWVNPDCGLKTRKMEETVKSLMHMVLAARGIREDLASWVD